jgi:hypothetical protein
MMARQKHRCQAIRASPSIAPIAGAQKNYKIGAGDGNRTHDMQLGKLPFYH